LALAAIDGEIGKPRRVRTSQPSLNLQAETEGTVGVIGTFESAKIAHSW
jgi:hypothetical protein